MKKIMAAVIVMAASAALSAAELETLKMGPELNAVGAEALRQVEPGGIPAPKPENAGQDAQTLNGNTKDRNAQDPELIAAVMKVRPATMAVTLSSRLLMAAIVTDRPTAGRYADYDSALRTFYEVVSKAEAAASKYKDSVNGANLLNQLRTLYKYEVQDYVEAVSRFGRAVNNDRTGVVEGKAVEAAIIRIMGTLADIEASVKSAGPVTGSPAQVTGEIK